MRVDEKFLHPGQGLMSDINEVTILQYIHRSETLVEIQQKKLTEQKPSENHNIGVK